MKRLTTTTSLVLTAVLLLSEAALAQQGAITGKVTSSENGKPLSGVGVTVKGTSKGTVTGDQGVYRIRAAPNDTLVFSSLAFRTREVAVGGRTVIDVALDPEAIALDAVVVTALGIEREKKALGYAVQEVDGAELQKVREPNLASALTGKVAGLVVYNPTGLLEAPRFSLRGSQPLVVVNGVPQDSAVFWAISPDDIEEISVLKGTAASALYGSRGKDGALMITTKKGSRRQGFSVTYNTSNLFQNGFVAIPEVQTQYGTGYGGKYAYVDGKGGGVFDGAGWIWGPRLDQRDANGGCVKLSQYDSPVDQTTGERTATCWTARGRNNLQNFLETGLITSHNISVANTAENGYFRASLSHLYQNGQVPNTELNNTSFALSGGFDFSERFRADASWTYNRLYTSNYPQVGYGPQNYVYNLLLWTGVDVDVRDLRNYWQEGKQGIQQRHYNYAWYNNPYFLAYENRQGYYKDVNLGQVSLDYDLSDALTLTARTGANLFNLNRDEQVPLSLINYEDPTNGNYILNNEANFDINTDLLLDYRKELNADWGLKATFGGHNRWYRDTWLSARTAGLNVPGVYNLSNSTTDVLANNRLQKKRTSSLFGAFDVAFRDAIFLGVTGRNDWSSALPEQNNSYFYPSVSVAAVPSELVRLPEAVPFFKVRASWARVASDLPIYSTVPVYTPGAIWNGTPSVAFSDSLLNPDIRPEQSTTWELGTDVRLLKDRLGLDLTYYNTVDENDIIDFPVSLASGYNARLLNANRYRRRGWEVVLNAAPVVSDALNWDVALNWSRHRRTLLELPDGIEDLNGVEPGERMDLVRGWVFARSSDGQIIYNKGFPTWEPDLGNIGYGDPSWVAGLNSTLRLNNFALDFQLDGRYKGLIYSQTLRKMWWGGTHPGTVTPYRDDENAGKATYVGDGVVVVSGELKRDANGNVVEDTRVFAPNTTPVFWSKWLNAYYHYAADEPNWYDASFAKLREVTLTYRLPQRWASRFSAEAASISLVGRNLWMWSEVPYIDPDSGLDQLQTPSARTVGFNVNLTF